MTIKQAFEKFMVQSFESAVDMSTRASWGGSGYSVELFDDGTYRVLWDNQIGNLYETPGLILGIPPLNDEEWDDEESLRFYENAEDMMREHYQETIDTRYEIVMS